MPVSILGNSGIQFPDNSLQTAAASPFGLKNRIINGDMRIDQRNAGASVTPTDGQYTLDRFTCRQTTASKFSVQQNAGSVTPPAGFTNYLGVTSLSAFTVGSGDIFQVGQLIEGYNVADLAWGTASAQTVTLSFWVRSSLTGTFGGVISNGANNRSYPFTYTITAANTWEKETITIPGDTSGTWLTTNGIGIQLKIGLGVGSTYSGTAGSWQAAGLNSATGATSVVGTNGATFYITGVQLEIGTSATPFERRMYGQELALCQRYLPVSASGTATGAGPMASLVWSSSTAFTAFYYFQVQPRIPPTGITISSASHFLANNVGVGNPTVTALSFSEGTLSGCSMTGTVASGGATAGSASYLRSNSTASAQIQFTGCEL